MGHLRSISICLFFTLSEKIVARDGQLVNFPRMRRANITATNTNYNHCNAKCVTLIETGQTMGCTGFAGEDCSFPYEVCPDSKTQCFGELSVCVNKESNVAKNKEEYVCDCRSPSTYSLEQTTLLQEDQIMECMNRKTEVCEKDRSVSLYAFCTNGGRCINHINTGEPHPGCDCPGRFVGHHCEHRRGTAPDDRTQSSVSLSDRNNHAFVDKPHIHHGLATWIRILASVATLVIVGFLGYASWLYKRFRVQHDSPQNDSTQDRTACIIEDVCDSASLATRPIDNRSRHHKGNVIIFERTIVSDEDEDDSSIFEIS